MTMRRAVCLLTILLSGVPMAAFADEKPKQQAKELVEKAKGEGADRAKQVQDFCAASALEPKDKKMAETCNSFRSGLIRDDTAMMEAAQGSYKNHDLEKAEAQAKGVSSYDDKLSGQAKSLIDRIKSDRIFTQVQAAWTKGDFQAVLALSEGIANPDVKASASAYINNVGVYKGYIEKAQSLEQSDPEEAIKLLTLAKDLNPNGPSDPAGKIAEAQKVLAAKKAPPPPSKVVAPTVDPAAELAKKVAKLINDAQYAEKQGDLQGALSDYAMALKLQPGNKDAQTNSDRIQQTIQNDPVAAKAELTSAIRLFYKSQFDDARRALLSYLESPKTALAPGVADFYLGATSIERSILQTPRAKWQGPSADALQAFKEAKKANYNPVRAYISPVVLKIWDSTAP
jgi:tetratricopeptide (TPR) repeat protein